MKRRRQLLFFTLLLLAICGCVKNPETNQNRSATIGNTAPANSNTAPLSGSAQNQNVGNSTEAAQVQTTTPTIPQAVLQGTYAIYEVQHDGIVEIVSSDNTTEITFKPPASFSRLSKKKGNVDHTDSGQYKIEGDNQLSLKIVMSKERFQLKPVEKIFGFWVSPNGDEMKLITIKDQKPRTAVFRRIKELTN
jgi:hypothetical protein